MKVDDASAEDLMLDTTTMDALNAKILAAVMPTFQQMLKSAIAEHRHELWLEMDDKIKTLYADKLDSRCERFQNLKK